MFTHSDDLILQYGPVWHGTAIGWKKSIEKYITKLPIISDRFCGVKYVDTSTNISSIAYTAYLPTSWQDEEFLEILSLLDSDISKNNTENSMIILGTDSNVTSKSTKRRREAIQKFLETFSFNSILASEEPTFHHSNQTAESQIDHVYFFIPESSSMKMTFKDHLCLKEEPSNISSQLLKSK